jgi:hypothetical protein
LAFLVWDPLTDERRELPRLPWYLDSWKATVLCAAVTATPRGCDHVDYHRGPFVIVFVGTDGDEMFTYVYSSEAGAWSKPVFPEHPGDRVRILKYDLGTQEISVVELLFVRTNQRSVRLAGG